MDIVVFIKHLYKKLQIIEAEKTRLLALGYAKSYEEYQRSVGVIEGLTTVREEIKALLDKMDADEDPPT